MNRLVWCVMCTSILQLVTSRLPPNARRIIGGTAVSDRRVYPWYAQLSKIGGYSTGCGMTIISPTWVVTACHCVIKGDYSGYHQGPGSEITYGCTSLSGPGCQTRRIKRWVPHPCYVVSCCDDHDDLCLAELEAPVDITEFPRVAGLNGTVSLPSGSPVRLIGMGATRSHGKGNLREVEVNTVSKSYCEQQEPTAVAHKKINFSNVICTGGQEGKDSCNGDSGSPVVGCWSSPQNITSTWMLGVLVKGSELPRSGPACGAAGRLAVYTKIELYADFILKTMRGEPFQCAGSQCNNGGGGSCAQPATLIEGMARCPNDNWAGPGEPLDIRIVLGVIGIVIVLIIAGCCLCKLVKRCRKSYDKLASVELDLGSTQVVGPVGMEESRHHSYSQPVEYDDVLESPQRMEVAPADNDVPESPVWEPPRHPTRQEMTDLVTDRAMASPRSLGLPVTASGRVVTGTLGPILPVPGAARTLEIESNSVSTEVQQAWSLLNEEDAFDEASAVKNRAYDLY